MTTAMQQAPQRVSAIAQFHNFVTGEEQRLRKLLPRDANTTNWIAQTISYFRQNPTLLQCTQRSQLNVVLRAARVGVAIDGQQSAILKFKDEAVWVIGYKGLVHLAAKYAKILDVDAEAVYAKDKFEIRKSSAGDVLEWSPFLGKQADRGDLIGFWAKCTLPNGRCRFAWMTVEEVLLIKNRALARSRNTGPWTTDEVEMSKKTVVKRLFKLIDVEPRLTLAVNIDNAVETGTAMPDEDGEEHTVQAEVVQHSQADEIAAQMDAEDSKTAGASSPVPEQSVKPETPAPAEPVADTLPPKTLITISRVGKARNQKCVADMDAEELSNAYEFAQAALADPKATVKEKNFHLGAVALLEQEMEKRKGS